MYDWLDREMYPFQPNFFETSAGHMHYVDEGSGPPVVMIHGTPSWSFLYRRLIKTLASDHRVIAPDHLGFGLSDKHEDASYRPVDHADRLRQLIEALELQDITLIVHDFGGSIGLAYALDAADNVKRLVLLNTWMWSLRDNKMVVRASRLFGGPVGKFLYKQLNFSPRFLMKMAFGNKQRLTATLHRHYTAVFPTPASRQAPWVLARELVGASDWYDTLWQRRDRLRHKPALLLWGMKDPLIPQDALERWQTVFEDARIETYPDAGHFVPEEVDDLPEVISSFCRLSAPAE
jgi:haloalkane dehalogenase